MKRYFPIFALIIIIISLSVLVLTNTITNLRMPWRTFPAQVVPGPNEAVFYLSPESGTFDLNSNFTIELRIKTFASITSVKAYLNFPAAVLAVNSIDTTSSVFGSSWENSSNNTTGKIQIQLSTPSPGYLDSLNTSGLIAKINFKAVAKGSAAVTYDPLNCLALKSDDSNVINLTNSTGGNFIVQLPCVNCGLGAPTINPSSPQANQLFTITCPTNAVGYDCIDAYSNNDLNICSFSNNSGTNIVFNCTGLSAGPYIAKCKSKTGTASNCCAGTMTTSYTVTPIPNFTISSITPTYLLKDKTNTLSVTGSNFNLSTDFYFRFMSGATAVTSITAQPQNSSSFSLSITSSQLASVPIGSYDLKLERSTDNQSQIYSQKILVTISGDISGPTAGVRDGKVNIFDLSRMMSKWGSTDAQDLAEVDINPGPGNVSKGKIDIYDANRMMANWLP